MKGWLAVMVGLLALAAAVAFYGLTQRYDLFPAQEAGDLDRRVDRLTGEVCLYSPGFFATPEISHCAR